MPSTVPAVKAGLRDWLRTQTGLRPVDGVTVKGAPPGPDVTGTNLVVLAEVTAPQTFDVMATYGVKTERATLTGFCRCTFAGNGDEAEDAARVAAYALFAVIETAIETDPSAGGVIPGPMRAEVTEGGLTEGAGVDNESGMRVAQVRWLLAWGRTLHDAARSYIASVVAGGSYAKVVEVGSRNVNGEIRSLVDAQVYVGIDLEDGPGVDVVGDCRYWSPPWDASLVVCAEVLEHAPEPREVVDACIGYLRPGGRLVVTCAGPGREPHSGHDGGPVDPDEHYANIEPANLEKWLAEDMAAVRVRYNGIAKDVYATGIRR